MYIKYIYKHNYIILQVLLVIVLVIVLFLILYNNIYNIDYYQNSVPITTNGYNNSDINNDSDNIIYCFWTGDNKMSNARIECLNNLRTVSECNVLLITKDNLSNYILNDVPLHPSFNYLSETHKADYLRTYFMNFYGGGYSDIKQDITEQQLNDLLQQGITLDQIAQIAQEQGDPIPPLVASMMEQQGIGISNSSSPAQNQQTQPLETQSLKSKKYPTMMNSTEYKSYQDTVKKEEEEKAKQTQSQKTNVYGYVFSPLLSEELMKDMKRTQGSFFVGVNIANLMI
uniref:Uncharacterized protein n=1 Tax=viral metagenome TaxID=1070528 RepID=A0A6C0I4I0_9ZZZZ